MHFQVINSDGIAVMGTLSTECVPDEETLLKMSKCGFKFKLNGSPASIKKIKEEILNKKIINN